MPRNKSRLGADNALLIVAASESDANMLYATRFFAPDPFIFFRHNGRKFMVMSDLEIDRAKKQAEVDHVLSLSKYHKLLRSRGKKGIMTADVLELIFKERRIRRATVPANFPALLANELRSRRIALTIKTDPFFDHREKKRSAEVNNIRDSLRVAELGLQAGIETLKRARVGKDGYLYLRGRRLTSEALKSVVNTTMMAEGWVPSHTIIAGGDQCCDPHNEGSGPLRAHTSIVFDIFPRSQRSGYFGDLSRTVVRGKASERLKQIYESVRLGQQLGFHLIRDGANAAEIHQRILDLFTRRGFPTGRMNGRMQGFFHGTGHGLGLDIHEPPRIGAAPSILKKGHVVTVEPGLYYIGVGGVRLEDVVLVTDNGNRNLTRYPRFLEI